MSYLFNVDQVVGPVVGETTKLHSIYRGRRGIRTPDFNRVKVALYR